MPFPPHRPLYREILHDAGMLAWNKRAAWVIAIGAGLVQTGGALDVLNRVLQQHLQRLPTLAGAHGLQDLWRTAAQLIALGTTNLNKALIGIKLGQAVLLALLLAVTILVLALVCQGALVYLLGARGRFTKPTLQEALAVGGRHVWAVAAINLLPVGAYALIWFALLAPFGTLITLTTPAAVVAYVLAIMVSLLVGFSAIAMHMLALQMVILEGAHVQTALRDAWLMLKRSWLAVFELSAILLAISAAIFVVSLVAFTVVALPVMALAVVAVVLQAPTVASVIILLCEALFILVMLTSGGFTIAFQYASWQRLYQRSKKGLAMAKLVRLIHHGLDHLKLCHLHLKRPRSKI